MKIIDRYVANTILKIGLYITLAIVGIDFFVHVSGEMKYVGTNTYILKSAFWYTTLIMPNELYQLFPIIGFLACLLGLEILANNNELLVLRVSGVSIRRITIIVFKTAFLVAVFVFAIGELLVPSMQNKAELYKNRHMYGENFFVANNGLWLKENREFIHINHVDEKQNLIHLEIFYLGDQYELKKAVFITRSSYIQDNMWLGSKVREINFNDAKKLNLVKRNNLLFPLPTTPKELMMNYVNHQEYRSLPSLRNYIEYLKKHELNSTNYELSFWSRVFRPFVFLGIVLLGIPFSFSTRQRRGNNLKFFVGIAFGLIFYLLNQFAGLITTVFNISPFLSSFSVLLFIGLTEIILLLTGFKCFRHHKMAKNS